MGSWLWTKVKEQKTKQVPIQVLSAFCEQQRSHSHSFAKLQIHDAANTPRGESTTQKIHYTTNLQHCSSRAQFI